MKSSVKLLPKEEFSVSTNRSLSTIDRMIKAGKIKTIKMDSGRIYIESTETVMFSIPQSKTAS